jgi:hypothetical protein
MYNLVFLRFSICWSAQVAVEGVVLLANSKAVLAGAEVFINQR